MIGDESDALPTPESIAAFVKKNAPKMKKTGMLMMHHGDPEVLREDDYKGHHITVRTIYHIEVDGKPQMGHLVVTNDGQVQAHGLPNYTFDSVIELMRRLIDTFPEDFESGAEAHDMPDMPGMSGMAGMPGMTSHAKAHPAAKAAGSGSKAGAGKNAAPSGRSAPRKKSK